MTGFEPRTSGIGSDRSTNWATTTSQFNEILMLMFKRSLSNILQRFWTIFQRTKFQQLQFDNRGADGGEVPVTLRSILEIPVQHQANPLHPVCPTVQHHLQLAKILWMENLDRDLRPSLSDRSIKIKYYLFIRPRLCKISLLKIWEYY